MPNSKEKEEKIIKLLQNKATVELGFKMLVESYSRRLYWHIRSIVKSHSDADDVLQNTFVKVFKGIKGFQAEAKLYTWLYRIATNESLTFLKRQKKTESMEAIGQYEKNAPAYHDEENTMHKLNAAIDLLPEKQKLVFNLRYFDEMTYQDIADITGTSIGALKASYHHAVKKLETYLTTNNIH
ncbi:MAG TPA: RNA polymerase sigma factor [Saprospiraceae bacterium]|nr:RNA polymerase sigma factor [Saprospiraceae bacterium]